MSEISEKEIAAARKAAGLKFTGTWLDNMVIAALEAAANARAEGVGVKAKAFVPNPDGFPYVNHKDNDPAHNRDLNLEWCTQKGNLDHARRQGRMPDNYWAGKRSPNASLSDETVIEIRRIYAEGSHSWEALAERFGMSKRAIGRLLRRETYSDV